jgi:hypothetical protein
MVMNGRKSFIPCFQQSQICISAEIAEPVNWKASRYSQQFLQSLGKLKN